MPGPHVPASTVRVWPTLAVPESDGWLESRLMNSAAQVFASTFPLGVRPAVAWKDFREARVAEPNELPLVVL